MRAEAAPFRHLVLDRSPDGHVLAVELHRPEALNAMNTAMILAIEAYNVTVSTEDRLEGVRAFNDKRRPQFTGR